MALSPFLYVMVMDRLTVGVRQEFPWSMMFANYIDVSSESREQLEDALERWRYRLEIRGMKFSCGKTDYLCE